LQRKVKSPRETSSTTEKHPAFKTWIFFILHGYRSNPDPHSLIYAECRVHVKLKYSNLAGFITFAGVFWVKNVLSYPLRREPGTSLTVVKEPPVGIIL
jgi:hypothetical protein